MSNVILSIENFSKAFRSHWTFRPTLAVHNLNLEVFNGESFGFLGHNGAGKTTTIKCILGLITTTKGRIAVCGEQLTRAEQNKAIGYLPEQPYFYDHLTVYETLDFFARLHEMKSRERKKRVSYLLDLVKLEDRAASPVRSLSKGLQQRLGFAQAIINEPKLLLLDEPFSGLDPLGRAEIRKLILDLKKLGTTVFLSSHILSDVEDICDRVAILSKGELKKVFYLQEIPGLFGQSFELRVDLPANSDSSRVKKFAGYVNTEKTLAGSVGIFEFAQYDEVAEVLQKLLAEGFKIESLKNSGPSLEDVFVDITEKDIGKDA